MSLSTLMVFAANLFRSGLWRAGEIRSVMISDGVPAEQADAAIRLVLLGYEPGVPDDADLAGLEEACQAWLDSFWPL